MVTSMPASAHRRATVAAWISEPPASTSSRSRQASMCTCRRPASAAMSPSRPAARARSRTGAPRPPAARGCSGGLGSRAEASASPPPGHGSPTTPVLQWSDPAQTPGRVARACRRHAYPPHYPAARMVDLAPGSVAANPPSGRAERRSSARGDDGSSTAERSGRPHLRHMPALDGLRGAAVAAVVLFHDAPLWNGDRRGRLVGGYLGVDLFFILSGFLITSLLLTEWRRTGAHRAGELLGPAGPAAPARRCSSCWPPWRCTPRGLAADSELEALARRRPGHACSTSPTGGPSSVAAGLLATCSPRRRRSSTRGAWRSRSSSTWSGRSWSSASSTWPDDAPSAVAAGTPAPVRAWGCWPS